MKKLFFAAAAAIAVFSVSNANAQKIETPCVCGQTVPSEQLVVHPAYQNGAIATAEVRDCLDNSDMNWRVVDRKHRQVWSGANKMGQEVTVKLKDTKRKDCMKTRVGNERVFAKDINNPKSKRHVAKIRENGEKYVAKNITTENGCEVMVKARLPKEKKSK